LLRGAVHGWRCCHEGQSRVGGAARRGAAKDDDPIARALGGRSCGVRSSSACGRIAPILGWRSRLLRGAFDAAAEDAKSGSTCLAQSYGAPAHRHGASPALMTKLSSDENLDYRAAEWTSMPA
jgi:hypothetical protein